MGREIPLSEEEKVRLEALFLRLELLNREVTRLLRERDALIASINERLQGIADRHGLDSRKLSPVFEDFKLVRLEAAD